MPSPLLSRTVQRSMVQPAPAEIPMPVWLVNAAVEVLLLATHCEITQSMEVMIPAEEAAVLVLLRAVQPMRVTPELVEIPATPSFSAALQLVRVAPLVTTIPLLPLLNAVQSRITVESPLLIPVAVFPAATQPISTEELPAEKPLP